MRFSVIALCLASCATHVSTQAVTPPSARASEPLTVVHHRALGQNLVELIWVKPDSSRFRVLQHRGDHGPATVETIDWRASRTIDSRTGSLGDVIDLANREEPCRRLGDGRRLAQDGDHVELVSVDGTSLRLDENVPAAYGPCFLGARLAVWTSYIGPEFRYDLVAMDLATRTKRHVANTTGIQSHLSVSPDGQSLVALLAERTPRAKNSYTPDRWCVVRVDAATFATTRLACAEGQEAPITSYPMLLISPSWTSAAIVFKAGERADAACNVVRVTLPAGERRGEGHAPCMFVGESEAAWNGLLGDDGLLLLSSAKGVTAIDLDAGRVASIDDDFSYSLERAAWSRPGVAFVPRDDRNVFELVQLDARTLLRSR